MSRERVHNVEFGFKLAAVSQVHIVFPSLFFSVGVAALSSVPRFIFQPLSFYSGRRPLALAVSKRMLHVRVPEPQAKTHESDSLARSKRGELTEVPRTSTTKGVGRQAQKVSGGRAATGLHM